MVQSQACRTITPVVWLASPEWLTLSEAAYLSGYDEATLLALIEEGDVDAEPNAAGEWQITKASLRDFQETLLELHALKEGIEL